jgi:succinate dehydrogenase (ubiquinone) cytochrome b560 subunit
MAKTRKGHDVSITDWRNMAMRPGSQSADRVLTAQLTWYLSSLTRVTGVALSGSLYLFSLAYLLHPSVLTSFDSAHIIQFAQDLPGWVKGSIKLPLAGMFWFHSFNGVRHLAWDIGYGMLFRIEMESGWRGVDEL